MPAKIRTIRAKKSDKGSGLIEFNRSITPTGGTLGEIQFIPRKNGSAKVKILQDTNNNGKIDKKELIYLGKITETNAHDQLTHFTGKIKLRKQMHSCTWDLAKRSEKVIACTLDYVPLAYALTLTDDHTDVVYNVKGIRRFSGDTFFTLNPLLSELS